LSAKLLPLDAETLAHEAPENHRAELRLWLRLLACTNLIEGEIRRRLRERFDTTLPRFDLMAQLARAPNGMRLSDLSRRMMVTNGNITGLVDRMVKSGHLKRRASTTDGRAQLVSLTPLGRSEFETIAAEHQDWIAHLFADLDRKTIAELLRLLGLAKTSVRQAATAPERG
jgi:DNA-binding MarR family transcriptional regulator